MDNQRAWKIWHGFLETYENCEPVLSISYSREELKTVFFMTTTTLLHEIFHTGHFNSNVIQYAQFLIMECQCDPQLFSSHTYVRHVTSPNRTPFCYGISQGTLLKLPDVTPLLEMGIRWKPEENDDVVDQFVWHNDITSTGGRALLTCLDYGLRFQPTHPSPFYPLYAKRQRARAGCIALLSLWRKKKSPLVCMIGHDVLCLIAKRVWGERFHY